MDPKASPLAMLAKTCSQIGADPPLPLSKINKPKTPDDQHSVKKDSVSPTVSSKDSRSRSSSTEIRVTDTVVKSDSSNKSSATTTPTVRSGIEVLNNSTSLHSPRAIPPTVSYPTVTSSNGNSALQNNPFLASFASQLSTQPSENLQPGVCRDPLCRDPLCPTALRNQQFLGGGGAYSYANLLTSPHYREAMMVMAAQQRMLASMATSPHTSGALPHVCGWMLGNFDKFSNESQCVYTFFQGHIIFKWGNKLTYSKNCCNEIRISSPFRQYKNKFRQIFLNMNSNFDTD